MDRPYQRRGPLNAQRPLSLLAELTYRCNLQCPYCYNPLDLAGYRDELTRDAWERVLDEAAELGVLQVHFSGGEPTLRAGDLCALVRKARGRELYTNLITQGTFLSDELIAALEGAGLDHVQLSLQAGHAVAADAIAGAKVHEKKLDALRRVAASSMAVTLNCVLHRANIENVDEIVEIAHSAGVRRVELANVQFYGWAFLNRGALMPTREQVTRASAAVEAAQRRFAGKMEISHVLADYYEQFPKPCMDGWGTKFMTVAPDGRVFPCPAAPAIAGMRFENVRDRSLGLIWRESDAFQAFRGTAWMAEPCRSCERREIDWGGCRCQAFLLTGDARKTDPACSLSPDRAVIDAALSERQYENWTPRRMKQSSS
jgi:pyrroloquinoline quinone biosynthesis protein E